MALPSEVVDRLRDNNFRHTYTNEYSGTDRFVRKIRDLPVNSRVYNNCAIVIETYAENFITLNIYGYTRKTGFIQNITRDIFPGQYQFVDRGSIDSIIASLEQYPFKWRTEFGF